MKFTTHFMHQSQGTWLLEDTPCTESCKWHTGLSPLSMLFSKGLLLHLNWWHISISQFRTRCPDFQTEPVLMHSPLLKESLWVSHPPPTYMLKFSGLAGLSSCFEKKRQYTTAFKLQACRQPHTAKGLKDTQSHVGDGPTNYALHVSKACSALTHKTCRSQAWLNHNGLLMLEK